MYTYVGEWWLTFNIQPKYKLLKTTVNVLGTEKSIELFRETEEVQKQGGVLSADGDKK